LATETQAIFARLDCDLAEILSDLAQRRFDPGKFRWKQGASVCVVIASEGYPGNIRGKTNYWINRFFTK